MMTLGYEICLIICILALVYMAVKRYERVDIYLWSVVLLISVVILGYWIQSKVHTPEAAELAFCFIYFDSTVMLVMTFFSMLKSFDVSIKVWMKVLGYGAAFGHCFLVWHCFGTSLYYSSIEVFETAAGTVEKDYAGPLKMIHVAYLVIILLLIIGTIIWAFLRNGTYSRKILLNYAIISVIGIVLYAGEIFVDVDFSLLPYLYTAAVIVIALGYDRVQMHDISCLLSEQRMYYSTKGFVALDYKGDFLSCNEKAFEFCPFLKQQREDDALPASETLFSEMIEEYKKCGAKSRKFEVGNMTCVCDILEFSIRKDGKKQGYLFEIRDATEEQKVLDVMEAYNTTLNAEVKEKTENIAYIQQKIVIGMANMIENRDNNTGGHVKRTSDIVQILVDELMSMESMGLTQQFAADVVRAAPMHDLGKISIDSHILCKPGRLNDEEYAIMKTHAPKSGEMVKILLEGVEETHFVNVAFNVARFHHERWDGKGYPDGLVGSMIPIEARIMAVADVYDALVSKRCYKEPMSFDKAKAIMCEGMGTQFDPNFENVFLRCLDKMEAYYTADYAK